MSVASEETRGLNYLLAVTLNLVGGCKPQGWRRHSDGKDSVTGLVTFVCSAPHTKPLHAMARCWEPECGGFLSPRDAFLP